MVITDCRFPNEIQAIHRAGGQVIRVCRGPEPEWYDLAVAANSGSYVAKQQLASYNVHASEIAWVGTVFNAVIDNNGGFDSTFEQVESVVLKS